MQTPLDLICTECSNTFDSASLLLQHFASHAVKNLENEITSPRDKKKNDIPNLYPINMLYDVTLNETDRGSDSGIEDVNPLKFCMVTMEEKQKLQQPEVVKQLLDDDVCNTIKKYQCNYCSKRFGWSTDLKRHILIHTGERPFRCPSCNLSFTRNFLLQKHQKKLHGSSRVSGKVPDLRPINRTVSKTIRKQYKCDNLNECTKTQGSFYSS